MVLFMVLMTGACLILGVDGSDLGVVGVLCVMVSYGFPSIDYVPEVKFNVCANVNVNGNVGVNATMIIAWCQ